MQKKQILTLNIINLQKTLPKIAVQYIVDNTTP